MIKPSSTYVYTPLTAEEEVYISGSLLNDRGSWLPQLGYVPPYDVAFYGGASYINTSPVTGIPPTGIVDEHWSLLVVAEEASGSVFLDDGSRQAADLALKNQLIQQFIDAAAPSPDSGTLAALAYALALQNGTSITIINQEITEIHNAITVLQTSQTTVYEQITNIYEQVGAGTERAEQAYVLAQAGTDAAAEALAAVDGKVDRAGDTMSGTLATVNVYYRAVTAGSSGTVAVDLGNAGFHTVNVAGDVHIVTANRSSGTLTRSTAVRFIGDAVDRNIGFAGEIRFLGPKPTVLTGGKYSVLSLTSFGPDESDTLAAYNFED